MNSRIVSHEYNENIIYQRYSSDNENMISSAIISVINEKKTTPDKTNDLAEIMVVTSY